MDHLGPNEKKGRISCLKNPGVDGVEASASSVDLHLLYQLLDAAIQGTAFLHPSREPGQALLCFFNPAETTDATVNGKDAGNSKIQYTQYSIAKFNIFPAKGTEHLGSRKLWFHHVTLDRSAWSQVRKWPGH